ncbi:hypothetical protein LDG_5731 [Legionella drancourtii LLAP12]|uniref:Uncharacterized protein n=1 Tax=Legionella drancourtii LLAP12 TaxID=658187 RepID=G9EKJ6_9GAMM|nr:hypothetical protein LDG_5731 [Legionella drancourtii LLAP12]
MRCSSDSKMYKKNHRNLLKNVKLCPPHLKDEGGFNVASAE